MTQTQNLVTSSPDAVDLADLERVRQFLYREARLLDDGELREWLTLFTDDGLYWVPIDENQPPERCASLVRDDGPARDERVYHLLETPFPAQSPPSRTVHVVSNIEVTRSDEQVVATSSQVVYEMRTGDFTQVGLGVVRQLVGRVTHTLVDDGTELKIACKKILLIDRDVPQGNLTFVI
jgi:3-phenylpropionate/cinnamic acid dioxygenase small subunit